MRTIKLLLVVAVSSCSANPLKLWINKSPNLQPPTRRIISENKDIQINANVFADNVQSNNGAFERQLGAGVSPDSPSAAAALAYLKNINLDGLCGAPSEAYIEAILNGDSLDAANAAATKIYIEAYNSGERLPETGACKEADVAYRAAYISGEDPILASARAYMDNWPGYAQGNPCAVAGVDYFNAFIDGKSHLESGKIASRSYADAFRALAKEGKALKDPACAEATRAYWEAVPNKPNPAQSAAFIAFIDKVFDNSNPSPVYDPACLASFDAFLDAYNDGEDLDTANLIAAQSFFKAYVSGTQVPADSACAAATKAYAKEVLKKPSPANAAAMIAYINEAIANGFTRIDPVCAASAEAYFDAYINKKEEAAANEAAAVAYIDALNKNPDFDVGSPCGKAAQAYISQFDGDL